MDDKAQDVGMGGWNELKETRLQATDTQVRLAYVKSKRRLLEQPGLSSFGHNWPWTSHSHP